MSSIDLIPKIYRDTVRTRRLLSYTAVGIAVLSALGVSASQFLSWQLRAEQAKVSQLRSEAARVAEINLKVETLTAKKKSLEDASAMLQLLRGQGEIDRLTQAIDEAMNAGVWLTLLRFHRSHQAGEAGKGSDGSPPLQNPAAAMTGMVGGQPGEPSRSSGHVDIQGTALDHAVLGDFMKKLSKQPGIKEVRFLSSTAASAGEGELIQFGAAVITQSLKETLP